MNKLVAHFFLWVFVLLGLYTRGFAGGWLYLLGLLTIALFTPPHIILHLSYTKVADKLKGLDVVLIGLSHLLFWSVFLFQYDFADDGDIIMLELFTGKVDGLTPQLAHSLNIIAMVSYPLVSLWLLQRRRKFSVSFPGIQRKLFQGYLILFLLVPVIGVQSYVWFSLEQEKRSSESVGHFEDLDRALNNPEEVTFLKLYRDRDHYTEIPSEVFQLTQLRGLSFPVGRITEIPPEIAQLQELRKLYLPNQRVRSIPDAIGQLSQLEILDLSYNRLESINPVLCECQNLREVHLSGSFKSVPPCLLELPRVRKIELNTRFKDEVAAGIPDWEMHPALSLYPYDY